MKQTMTDTFKIAMQKHGKVITGGFLVSLLLAGGVSYSVVSQGVKTPEKTSQVATKTDSEKSLIEAAEKAVSALEADQVAEKVEPAQTATDKLKTSDKKTDFQERIDAVKTAMAKRESEAKALAEAERLVAEMEANQGDAQVAQAQTATDKVADAGKKAGLQGRIDAVKTAMAERSAQAQAQAEAAQAAPAYQAPAQAAAPSYQAPVAQAPQEAPKTVEERQQLVDQAELNFNNQQYNY